MLRRIAPLLLPFVWVACGGSTPPAESPAPKTEPTSEEPEKKPEAPAASEEKKAPPAPVELTLEAKSGSKLAGKAKLEAVEGGVKVSIEVSGVSPGAHGAHVHEKGDCSSADGKSAGDHFNPGGHQHGMPPGETRHLGDLGNLDVQKNGEGKLEITIVGANLEADDPHSFLGRAIIIHEKKDDGGQPTGNAGGRIGCGVIKR